ncbi:hypothetical protein FRC17_001489 [Serendipita sp. 399]|nr:hypothetical protein FRC17_001489 [Serendipita sp. 399]
MFFDEMKQALALLNHQSKALDAFKTPMSTRLSVPAPSSASSPLEEGIPLIENFQRSIIDLFGTLNETFQQYISLISVTRDATRWVPNEIIIKIFEFVIKGGSHHLKPLLLVNKRFHWLVMSIPSLWCNIYLKFDNKLKEINKLSLKHIERCTERSQTLPLNMDLNLSTISGPQVYVQAIMPKRRRRIALFNDAEYEMSSPKFDKPSYAHQLEGIGDLVEAIMGPRQVHMRRWRSLTFSLPVRDDVPAIDIIQRLFVHPMPNLEEFTLNRSDVGGYALPQINFSDSIDLQHLTILHEWSGRCLPVDAFSWDNLRTLIISYHSFCDPLGILSRCIALQGLTIEDIDNCTIADEQDVELPSLRRLTLEGVTTVLEDVKFCTPCLERLTLHCNNVRSRPKVQARSVTWTPKSGAFDVIANSLGCLLAGIEEMEELIIQDNESNDVSAEVRSMIQQRPEVIELVRVIKFIRKDREDVIECDSKQIYRD